MPLGSSHKSPYDTGMFLLYTSEIIYIIKIGNWPNANKAVRSLDLFSALIFVMVE